MSLIRLLEKIEALVPQVPGWCSIEKAQCLAALVYATRPEITVEIGIFGGASFFPLALAHKDLEYGVAIGIEPWSTAVAVAVQTEGPSREWWQNQDLNKIRDGFFQRIRELQLEPFTKIFQKSSAEVPPPLKIGLLHIDGAHNEEAINDVRRFGDRVQRGGFCVMDDLQWTGGAVARAEQHLLALGFTKLYSLESGAVYLRDK